MHPCGTTRDLLKPCAFWRSGEIWAIRSCGAVNKLEKGKVLLQLRQRAMSVETLISSIAMADRHNGQTIFIRSHDATYPLGGQFSCHRLRSLTNERGYWAFLSCQVRGLSNL
jgi:hypothetical protein